MTISQEPPRRAAAPATPADAGVNPGTGGMDPDPSARRFWRPGFDVLAWALVAVLLLLVRTAPGFRPDIYDDSFQYFSVATNTLNGLFGETSLLHFDAERSFGTIPAPEVTAALGFPVAVALVRLTGLPIEGAALLVSGVSTVGSVLLVGWMAGALGLSRLFRNVVLACFVLNAALIQFGVAALSDALFTFVVLLGLALLLAAQRHRGSSATLLWVAAGLAFGGAFLVRYAGLFFVIGLACLVLRHLISSHRSLARGHALALIAATLPVAAGMARNVLLVGDWRGGNTKVVSKSLGPVILDLIRGVSGPFLGIGNPPATLILRALLVGAFMLAVLWLTTLYVRRLRRARLDQDQSSRLNVSVLIDILLLAGVYIVGILFTSVTSFVYPDPRYFTPLTPMFLLVGGAAIQTVLSAKTERPGISLTLPAIVLGACFVLYVYLGFTALQQPRFDGASPVASQLDRVSSDGRSARKAILDHLGPTKAILANNGQAVGYVLDLPTVSLAAPIFSDTEWNEASIRDTLQRYGANVIVVSLPHAGAADDFLPSPFVRQLAMGEAPPWLELVFRSDDYMVYTPRARSP